MTLERLDNLVKTGEVHEEAADQGEFKRLVSMARRRLADSQVSGLSEEGQFLAAYSSAHSLQFRGQYTYFGEDALEPGRLEMSILSPYLRSRKIM